MSLARSAFPEHQQVLAVIARLMRSDGMRRFIRVLLLWKSHSEQDVRNAVAHCVARRIFSVDAIVAALRNEPVFADDSR